MYTKKSVSYILILRVYSSVLAITNIECGLPGIDVDVPWRDKGHVE